ncbi:MAG: malate synthase G [Proteobacteria bacterium]|nr:malate synthase G [Pseudomonadota bacterium]NOG59883.1 malate synthase G [Pseudomonadota bacterium]
MAIETDNYISVGNLQINKSLHDLVKKEIAPRTDVTNKSFWTSLEKILQDYMPRNLALLKKRDSLQKKIDNWHIKNRNKKHNPKAYKKFLKEIGYLVDNVEEFSINTENVDDEIAMIPGPQLVVPLDNARYVLNAVNARWGSLYDASYSTDTISQANGCKKIKRYNPIRGDRVILRGRNLLDRHFPLERDTHKHITQYFIKNNQLAVRFGDDSETTLLKPQQFIGYTGKAENPDSILLCHHNLHLEIKLGAGYFIGRRDHAKIYDIQLESAVTTIMDCEDSVASVDIEDKLKVYNNWLGLMKGTLVETVEKEDGTIQRAMEEDKTYIGVDGKPFIQHSRSLMLVRNVGHHLYTDMVLYDGKPVPETMIDLMVTSLCAIHDLKGNTKRSNSRKGSVYIVKPKMHGSEEVAFANELFGRTEEALKLPANTLKMGIMDEERRTSVNLKACIYAAKERVVFINTGFLDRTGDDIHTNMEAGPIIPKAEIKQAKWLQAYEDSNVQVGLDCGLMNKAQIGKGMWAMPEEMTNMMKTKIQHLKAGASTSWVPSPVAATLHAIHYHRLNIKSRQVALMEAARIPVDDILDIPVIDKKRKLSPLEIRHELENNAQGILGYVSRWVGQGVGCSKVPDINDVALMEDCATLRISSQHIANWLHHGIVTKAEVREAMKRMAVIVDRQNRDDKHYQPMSKDFSASVPFLAAIDLVLKGRNQANGYTEFILYKRRLEQKILDV